MRESSPPEAVSATGANGSPGLGRIRNDDLVRAGRARFAFSDLGAELALAEADAVQLRFDRGRERRRRGRARFFDSRSASFFVRVSASASAAARRLEWIGAVLERGQLGSRFGRPREQLRVGLAAEPPLGVGDPLQLRLHLLQPIGLGLQRVEKPPQLERRLVQPELGVAKLTRGHLELWSDPRDLGQGPLRSSDERGRALTLVRRERRHGPARRLRELGHVPKPLTLGEQRRLGVLGQPVGVLDESPQLREPRLLGRRAASSARRAGGEPPRAPARRARSSARSRSCSSPTNASRTSS